MKLVKDRRRLEQLVTGAAGGNGSRPAARVRDVEMEEVMEELHEKVRGLQLDNERLKQRLLVAKQQVQVQGQSRKPSPYGRVQSRVDTGRRRAREDSPSPSRLHQRGEAPGRSSAPQRLSDIYVLYLNDKKWHI